MTPNDLRIGNEFEYLTPEGWERNIIDVEDIAMCIKDNTYFNTVYRPLPLTEDILLKWGFGNKRNTNINGCIEYTYLNSMNLSKSYDLILTIHNGIYRLYYKLEIIGVRRLKYIHQFQNFFQIITEKELTVNL